MLMKRKEQKNRGDNGDISVPTFLSHNIIRNLIESHNQDIVEARPGLHNKTIEEIIEDTNNRDREQKNT